jgi:hypothetical protein
MRQLFLLGLFLVLRTQEGQVINSPVSAETGAVNGNYLPVATPFSTLFFFQSP